MRDFDSYKHFNAYLVDREGFKKVIPIDKGMFARGIVIIPEKPRTNTSMRAQPEEIYMLPTITKREFFIKRDTIGEDVNDMEECGKNKYGNSIYHSIGLNAEFNEM